ncbi:protein of unknown function [Desulfocicer vacuolatum DSM 3385]|uniref:DUF3786 domain-containing protein n=1 Tax=Desulfocicer vacuolatum DSM 3385 TaxID=1121400 RepID=A0A1W2EN28_9BACT|nr:DUF3786 domain-containing protein [Desulfocicer vacuolatum]SMD11045.1 protein of unknown function [Desulfocicer vacuolatum DSM 3385]
MGFGKSEVFEETYANYLKEIEQIDLKKRSEILGGRMEKNHLCLPFYDQWFSIGPEGIFDVSGKRCGFSVAVVLLKYILMCPDTPIVPGGEWLTFRDFKDSGPLISYFTANTNKTLEQTFAGKCQLLKDACGALGAKEGEFTDTYDISLMVNALPKIPVMINFNDRDEEFPAAASILYRKTTEVYLDMESLAISGTWLAGRLLNHGT